MQTNISPVAVFPGSANVLYIRSIGLGPPPSYYYELQQVSVVEKTREVWNPDYVPFAETPSAPASKTPATITETYTETIVTVLKNGNVGMTETQWKAWPADADDENVQLDAISANLGLTRV